MMSTLVLALAIGAAAPTPLTAPVATDELSAVPQRAAPSSTLLPAWVPAPVQKLAGVVVVLPCMVALVGDGASKPVQVAVAAVLGVVVLAAVLVGVGVAVFALSRGTQFNVNQRNGCSRCR